MKKILVSTILLGCIAIFFASCGEEAKANNNLYVPTTGNNGTCHTILVDEPLATSVVGKEDVIRTGQSVKGAVKDHARNYPGYTEKMFMADNPQIAGRPTIKKLDPCDSTKVSYVGIPLYSGDKVLLRLPYRVDTITGYAESIVWKAANTSSHIKKILDIDDKGRVVVEYQNIYCGVYVNPCPPQTGDGTPRPIDAIPPGERIITPPSDTVTPPTVGDGSGNPPSSGYTENGTPWWVWLMFVLIAIVIYMIAKVMTHKQADGNSVGNITEVVQAEGKKTREHVTKAMDGLGGKVDSLGGKMDTQTTATNTTNELLRKLLEK